MPAGRPPKTPSDKTTRGTLRKSRVRKTGIKLLESSVYIPQHLDGDERMAWQTMGPVLKARGMMTVDYAAAFEQLCCSWARIRKLSAAMKRDGMVYQPPALDSRGVPVLDADRNVVLAAKRQAPEAGLLQAEVKIFRTWLAAFGLTPADIGRVDAPPPADDAPPGSELLD